MRIFIFDYILSLIFLSLLSHMFNDAIKKVPFERKCFIRYRDTTRGRRENEEKL